MKPEKNGGCYIMRNNDEIINLLSELKDKKGLSISELARRVGMAKSALSRYFNKTREFPLNKINEFANALGVSPEYILGFEETSVQSNNIVDLYNQLEKPRQKKVYKYAESLLEEQNKVVELPNRKAPLLGDVAANPTELAYGDPVYDEEVTSNVPSGADGALTIQGDSMEDLFKNGDICFFHRQPDVENGEIAIVEIDGTGVTCKQVIKENGTIILRSLNDKYDDRKIEKESVRIIGKVIV